jgi:hypothetical protein
LADAFPDFDLAYTGWCSRSPTIICDGDAQQKRDLQSWLEGWNLCLAEISFQLYGLPSSGLLNVKFLNPEQALVQFSAFAAAGKTLQDLPIGTAPATKGSRG